MDAEFERYVARALDPRLIPGIYNYCHRRCERCAFTERCLTFQQMRDDEAQCPGLGFAQRAREDIARTGDLLKAWCEREGIDFDKLQDEASWEQADAEHEQLEARIIRDPLYEQARTYSDAAFELVSTLERLAPYHEWSPVVGDALETIGWYAGMVATRVHRALRGLAERDVIAADDDAIQNDWNGSAKVARLALAESRRAWDTLLLVGDAPPDARLRATRELLDRIDGELAMRFPLAMEFVRPGFDEPEIAAGALSTLACFEPRRAPAWRGVVAWLHRIAGAWQRRS